MGLIFHPSNPIPHAKTREFSRAWRGLRLGCVQPTVVEPADRARPPTPPPSTPTPRSPRGGRVGPPPGASPARAGRPASGSRHGTAAGALAPGTSSPSTTICTALEVSGGKPRCVACARAQSGADLRAPNVPNTFLLIGPCNRPSSPRRKVYITTSVVLRPYLLLSHFFRLSLRPRRFRLARPRCRWHRQPRAGRGAAPAPARWPWGPPCRRSR
jgi:hypothetical protein